MKEQHNNIRINRMPASGGNNSPLNDNHGFLKYEVEETVASDMVSDEEEYYESFEGSEVTVSNSNEMFDEPPRNQVKGAFSLSRLNKFILWALILVLPIFFIPTGLIPFQMGKGLLFALVVVVSFAIFIVDTIKSGLLNIPNNLFFLAVILVPVTFLISALGNGAGQTSFLGFASDIGTVGFVFLGVILVYLISQNFGTKERAFYAYLAFIISAVIVGIFQVIHLLIPGFSFGPIQTMADNLIGSWNELAMFFGAVAVLSIVTFEMVSIKGKAKILFWLALVLSLIVLIIVNFKTAWFLVGLFSLAFFIFLVSFNRFSKADYSGVGTGSLNGPGASKNRKISYFSLVTFILSILFIASGSSISGGINDKLGISNVEIRPSIGTTMVVAKATLSDNWLIGSGPNRFAREWLLYKPTDINQTIFWNTDFSYGIGLIPTFLVTVGILGVASWVFLALVLVWLGIRTLFSEISDNFSKYLLSSSFFLSIYFFVVSFVYVPNVSTFFLLFVFMGLFAATLIKESYLKVRTIDLSNNPKINFVSVLVLVAVLVGVLALGYGFTQKTVSFAYFQKGVSELNNDNNLDAAERNITKAANIGEFDVYYRALSELNLLRLNSILSDSISDPEVLAGEAQRVLAQSINNAQTASNLNADNYQNWVSLARVYASLVPAPLQVPGAYDNALLAYNKALENNPQNPALYMLLANLEISNNDLTKARDYINKAIELKENYAYAHFLLSQLEVTEGNTSQAIRSLERAAILSPNNSGLYFQLGLLKYNQRDWKGAENALKIAVDIVPDYANAKYFLGLTYYFQGDIEKAMNEFEDIQMTNPDNEEVKLILGNLDAGNPPFIGVEPPLDNRPERRSELPIGDNN